MVEAKTNSILVVRSPDTLTMVIVIVEYPMISALTLYVPAGTFRIIKYPFSSTEVPITVSAMITLAPGSGLPVSLSVTVPVIFPVSPANTVCKRKNPRTSDNAKLIRGFPIQSLHNYFKLNCF